MTEIGIPDWPRPTGAVAGDWHFLDSLHPEDAYRPLAWARFDAGRVVVAVRGPQFGDGRIQRFVAVDAIELASSAAARQLAAGLLNAADALDNSTSG